MLFGTLLIASYIGFIVLSFQTKKRNKEFSEFLTNHANDIMYGSGSEFEGRLYTRTTKLVRYDVCISYFIMTSTRSTYYVPYEDAGALPFLVFFITFIGGWWGIPWGPIKTIGSFINNFRGKYIITVGELFN